MLFRHDKKNILEIIIELDEIDSRLSNVGAGRGTIPEEPQLKAIREGLQKGRNDLKDLV